MHGLEQVGLARAVRPDGDGEAVRHLEVSLGVVAEVTGLDPDETHLATGVSLAWVRGVSPPARAGGPA